MRDSIGGSFLLYVVIFFVGIIILFFASIMSYSKAYRVKNRIINVVENSSCSDTEIDIIKKIDSNLTEIGYTYTKVGSCNFNNNGSECQNFNLKYPNNGGNFNYCICKIDRGNSGYYFEVITFTEFEFPIIKNVIRSNVHGESKIMCKNYKDD